MKKIVYSSALIALLLAGCGTDTDEAAAPSTTVSEQQATDSAEEQSAEQADQSIAEKTTNENSNSNTTNSNNSSTTSASKQADNGEKTTLTLYASNVDATSIVPFEVSYEGAEDKLVPFIFEKVDLFETNLLDYQFENDGASLILNIDDSIFNVQGSSGGTMYTNTLAQSFFDNFPSLNEVTFLYNGSTEPVVDHVNIGQPYTRADITNIAQ